MSHHSHKSSSKKPKKNINLPSFKLPVKPLTSEELDRSIDHTIKNSNKEFIRGFDFIKKHPKSVTFFGSARLNPQNRYYQKAERIAAMLAKEGYSVVTGGGPGIMEAANKGAFAAHGQSLGLTIELPTEQNVNPFVTDHVPFFYFFTRKVCLTFSAEAYCYFPGGFGTLDEFFEILTLVQTNKILRVPLILVGSEFWNPMNEFISQHLYEEFKTISKSDLDLYYIMDDEEEIVELIKNVPVRRGG